MQYNVRAAGLSPAALFVSNYAKTRRDTLISRPIKGKITMENKKKRIVIALGGNALGNTLPEQMKAVKITAKAIVDLIEEGYDNLAAFFDQVYDRFCRDFNCRHLFRQCIA